MTFVTSKHNKSCHPHSRYSNTACDTDVHRRCSSLRCREEEPVVAVAEDAPDDANLIEEPELRDTPVEEPVDLGVIVMVVKEPDPETKVTLDEVCSVVPVLLPTAVD